MIIKSYKSNKVDLGYFSWNWLLPNQAVPILVTRQSINRFSQDSSNSLKRLVNRDNLFMESASWVLTLTTTVRGTLFQLQCSVGKLQFWFRNFQSLILALAMKLLQLLVMTGGLASANHRNVYRKAEHSKISSLFRQIWNPVFQLVFFVKRKKIPRWNDSKIAGVRRVNRAIRLLGRRHASTQWRRRFLYL